GDPRAARRGAVRRGRPARPRRDLALRRRSRDRGLPPASRARAHPARAARGDGAIQRREGLMSVPIAQETQGISVTVNGATPPATVEPRLLLADLLREDLGLRGTHLGCEHGVCGACTILLDGEPARSCLLLAIQADGREVTTVEGIAGGEGL